VSTFEVKIHQVEVFGHPNADALELAQVGLFRAVVAKGAYRTGDYALYIPEAAVLPDELIEELGLTGRLAGTHKNRVKAIRLRGELSQGIVCRPDRVTRSNMIKGDWVNAIPGDDLIDWADTLGIHKYEPPIPVHLAGKVRAQTNLLPWIEIENIKKYPSMFSPGEPVYATEKIHGTCCLTTYVRETGEFLVSSKGMAKQGLCLEEEPGNTYWRAVRAAGVEEVLKSIADRWNASRVALFGEVFGAGVQDLAYGFQGSDGPQFRAFDMAVETEGSVAWVPTPFVRETLEFSAGILGTTPVPVVPILYVGPYDYEALCAVATGDTVVGNGRHLREGVVVRPSMERFHRQSRVIAKFINPAYLVRKGETTEFE
jgi:RNA ligase (TIGR02306 family)